MVNTPKTPKTPDGGSPDVPVPKLVGLMAVDARQAAREHGVLIVAADRDDFDRVAVEYVVRQYPLPGVEVPRDAVVTVWFDLGEGGGGGGGAGVRVPRAPGPRGGGMRREIDEPGEPPARSESFSPCP
ncbi:PASTA domain-containing protein [Streptomyces sp. NPDC059897]|uniref:PASTA domain-containing protein n=1 Tax=Streptomyces sp. NPDC059897 TaxID=3346994 RepID=UPI003656DD59